jgi:metal-responsive CopG/Arc/MetJ family transcriptional regulator
MYTLFAKKGLKSKGDHVERQITMKLPEDMYNDLKELSSKKDNIPLGNLIRKAIDDYLRKNRMKGNL